jgi:DNA-binding MarR family transcriptional regulator
MLEQKYLSLLDEAQRSGQSQTANMRICFEILALASAIDRACASRLAPHRLSEGKFVLLFLLRDLPEGLAPYELAQRAGVTRATITGLLDGLERDGFLARYGNKEDRRKLSVRLTTKGQALALNLFNEHSQWISSLLTGFDQHEREALSVLLRRVWRNVETPMKDRAAVAAGNPR